MKLVPYTDEELEFIRWRIWEPLRRNQHYRTEYERLLSGNFFDTDAVDAFCEKWNLPYHLHPETEFKEFGELRPNPFIELYQPLFDHAAFVDPYGWITGGKYLNVWVDLKLSKNKINQELKKILDEWRLKWRTFYGENTRKGAVKNPVIVKEAHASLLHILIDLEAPRTSKKKELKGYIDPELNSIIGKLKNVWDTAGGEKERIGRLSKAWEKCFKVFDLVEKNTNRPFHMIASTLGIKTDTAYKRYNRARMAVYPYSVDKEEINMIKAIQICKACPKKSTCSKFCPPVKRLMADRTSIRELREADMNCSIEDFLPA